MENKNAEVSQFIKTLGELKIGDQFKFVFRDDVQDKVYEVFQFGRGESACCAMTGAPDTSVWHHSAKVFKLNKTKKEDR